MNAMRIGTSGGSPTLSALRQRVQLLLLHLRSGVRSRCCIGTTQSLRGLLRVLPYLLWSLLFSLIVKRTSPLIFGVLSVALTPPTPVPFDGCRCLALSA